jgi:hypothetical protein
MEISKGNPLPCITVIFTVGLQSFRPASLDTKGGPSLIRRHVLHAKSKTRGPVDCRGRTWHSLNLGYQPCFQSIFVGPPNLIKHRLRYDLELVYLEE